MQVFIPLKQFVLWKTFGMLVFLYITLRLPVRVCATVFRAIHFQCSYCLCADSMMTDFTARALGIHIAVMFGNGNVSHFPQNLQHRLELLRNGVPRTVMLSHYIYNPARDAGHYEAVGTNALNAFGEPNYPACTEFLVPDIWSFANLLSRDLQEDQVMALPPNVIWHGALKC